MKRSFVVIVLGVLVGAVVVQFLLPPARMLSSRGVHLAAALPASLVGWVSKPTKLGATETLQGAVEKVLGFDDVFFREYQSDRGWISLYVAYWSPGKMPTQIVASHTPDRCWTSAGWICGEIRHRVPIIGCLTSLCEGERRIFFAPGGQKLAVQFWLMVGGRQYDFGEGFYQIPSAWRWWRDAARQVVVTPPEQYFVRLSSDKPFEELAGDPGWEELLARLAAMGFASSVRPQK